MKKTIITRVAGILGSTVVLSGLIRPAEAQDVELIGVIKNQQFVQESAGIVRLSQQNFWKPVSFECFADSSDSAAITSATVTPPGGSALDLQLDDGNAELTFSAEFLLEVNSHYPDGDYACHVVTGSGPLDATLSLTGNTYPNVPRISNFTAAQSISAASGFTFTWDGFTGGTTGDFIEFAIEEESGNEIFHSGPPGPGGLNGEDTSILVPAGTLASGKIYQARLMFAKIVDMEDISGTLAIAAYTKITEFSIRTAGVLTETTNPILMQVSPSSSESDVPVRSVVAFQFNEPMNPTSHSLQWTGTGLTPASFTYHWSADGRMLSAVYGDPAGLPPGTEISWEITANDLAGNPLPQTQSGSFTTSDALATADPDVADLFLIKNHINYQDGDGVQDASHFILELSGSLNTMNGVVSGSLTTPSGGIAAFQSNDGDEFDFEADYASKTDMDRFFPNGDHAIVLNTAHDGTKSATLNFPADTYPSDPTIITEFTDMQAVDPSQAFTVSWSAMVGGSEDEIVILEIEAADGDSIFSTPEPGESGALNGLSTSVEIPANTLSPGRTYSAMLIFAKVVDMETASYAGVSMVSVFAKTTLFEMSTTGTPIMPKVVPTSGSYPFQLQVTGESHVSYLMEASTNLQNWYEISYPQSTWDGTQTQFEDSNSNLFQKRFYRIREITNDDFYQKPVAIQGMVVNATNNSPIAGATVSTTLDSNTTVTDADGMFFLQTGFSDPEGETSYSIQVMKSGFQTFSNDWNWGNQPRNQWFGLQPQP